MDRGDVGKGALLGALAGDAAGATLEFLGRKPERPEVLNALKMVGGGWWRTAPGQITDDGELCLSLMSALAGKDKLSIEAVAASYYAWYTSVPFDRGRTIDLGLSGGEGQPAGLLHQGMWKSAESFCKRSKANGALMRVAPLGVWGHRLSEQDLVDAACQDSRLTHSNLTCQHASALYCLAIRHLMITPGDAEGAFQAVKRWAEKLGNAEVSEWVAQAERNDDVGYYPQAGFVKYAFVHALRHMKARSAYLNAVFETLLGGGDTDTNACIVGGLVGALNGEQEIPAHMREAVLQCDTTKGRHRPESFQPRVMFPRYSGALVR